MRLLCLSLLRTGDALVHLPAIANLAGPDRELHVLLQPVAAPAREILAPFAQVHLLPRNFTGGALELTQIDPPLPAIDRVINLTLNSASAELAARIGARDGVRAEGISLEDGRASFSSPWLRLLNDWGTCARLSVLHYADLGARALCEAPRPIECLPSAESASFWRRARADLPDGAPIILLQATTSEGKKSYPRARFLELARALAQERPDAAIFLLGAHAEESMLHEFCASSAGAVRPLPCTLAQAAAALREARLLISADTALVHLAALTHTQVLLLSSGSSAFRELGPRTPGSLVLQAEVPCAPCAHDLACILRGEENAAHFPCTESIPAPEAVRAALALLEGNPPPLPDAASVRAYATVCDRRGLTDYAHLGPASPADLCAALLRGHLLAQLDSLHDDHHSIDPARTRWNDGHHFMPLVESDDHRHAIEPLSPAGRGSLLSMAALIDGLLLRARGGGRAALDRALREAREFMLLDLARVLAGRIRACTEATRPQVLDELGTLRARIDRALR